MDREPTSPSLACPPPKLFWLRLGPRAFLVAAAFFIGYKYVDPAPPSQMVISTSDGGGDYQTYAKQYKDIIKEEGVDLIVRPSEGGADNLHKLEDLSSGVDAGFVQDGLGSPEQSPDLVSLGSMYYEPIWIFYRGSQTISRFTELRGKRVAIGREGGGTHSLAVKLLSAGGINAQTAHFSNLGWQAAARALQNAEVDAAVFMATSDDPVIESLVHNPLLKLVSLDQAEAITRQIPYLHHLILPHGSLDLKANLPKEDIDLVSPTATLLVRETLHPALAYLLLKAAAQVHNEPGIFERKDEFPSNKDYQFPLSEQAKSFYKSGVPFWQRYLPFWLATLVERFMLIVIPVAALVLPLIRMVPKFIAWRVRNRIFQRYGELKFLEAEIKPGSPQAQDGTLLSKLDAIEDRVNQMKVPLDFSDHTYILREHIDFVRKRLRHGSQRTDLPPG